MKNEDKTKEQLIDELEELSQRVAELETSEAGREHAEEQLLEQNEFIRNTLESVIHPFYVIDADDYTIKMANSAARARYGDLSGNVCCHTYTHRNNEPCGKSGELCPLEEVRKTKKAVTVEHTHYDKDNNARIFEVHGNPIFDSEGNVVRMIEFTLDVTERKQVEEALRISEELHRIILGSISDAVFITDDSGAFVYICPNVDVIFGYSHQEVQELGNIAKLLGKDIFDVQELESLGEVKNVDTEIKDKLGDEHSLLVNVKSVSIKGGTLLYTCRDITERKKAQEVVHSLRALNENVIQSTQDGLVAMDMDFRITLWNRAMEKISGYNEEEVVGRIAFDVFPHLKEEEVDEIFKIALEGRIAGRSNIPYETPKGKTGYTNVRCLPLRDIEGKVIGVLNVVEDVTEVLHREQELARLQEEIKQRKLIEVAKGILMREIGLSEAEAYQFIQKRSQDESRKMAEIARRTIEFFGSPEEQKKFD